MQQTLRPYVTAGVAIVGSSLIAATPVAAPAVGGPAVRDVALAAGGALSDLSAPWTAVFNEASDNATHLLNNYYLGPGVDFQQMLALFGQYTQSVLDDPSTIPDVMQQIQANLDAYLTGYTLINASGGIDLNDGFIGTAGTVLTHTLSATDLTAAVPTFGHDLLFALLPQFLPADQSEVLTPIIDFLASPLSAILIGAIGPGIAPWVALSNSIADGDDFNTILANMSGAFFNGATLNLDWLIPIIEQSGLLPMPEGAISHLDFAFGGLLSGGSVAVGPYQLGDAEVPAVGGSIFNSLGIGLDAEPLLGLPLQLSIDSHGIGPIGAWQAWAQTASALLGSGWSGKGPIEITPPGAGTDLPNVPDELIDDGGAGSGAADWMDLDAIIAAMGALDG